MKAKDWVVQPETWRSSLAGPQEVSWETYVDFPLTVGNYNLGGVDQERYRQMDSTESVLAVVGMFHWQLAPSSQSGFNTMAPVFAQQYLANVQWRLRVVTGDPELQQATPLATTYDLRTAPTANERFMAHGEFLLGNLIQGFWSTTPAVRTRWFGTQYVRTQSRRRLGPLDQVVLTVQFSALRFGLIWGFEDLTNRLSLWVTPRARALLTG